MAELPKHQAMDYASEVAYDVPAAGRVEYWRSIQAHAEGMRLALEDHPHHAYTSSEDCSICRDKELEP